MGKKRLIQFTPRTAAQGLSLGPTTALQSTAGVLEEYLPFHHRKYQKDQLE